MPRFTLVSRGKFYGDALGIRNSEFGIWNLELVNFGWGKTRIFGKKYLVLSQSGNLRTRHSLNPFFIIMNSFPNSLTEAVAQAKEATKAAIADGYGRLQVELVLPEIPLQAQSLALEFAQFFEEEYGSGIKIMFPDTGAAMLAKRDWGESPFQVTDMGSRFTSVESQMSDTDQLFIVACPSSVEVERVEKLCDAAGDRPVILLIPQLEDVAVVGIGLAARQLRDRFILSLIHI